MMYYVTKTYGHEQGLSACFRQHRATSHCRFLHGYPLSFRVKFGAEQLDENGWVIDFGSLKRYKQWLVDTFDHKLLVAKDDPMVDVLLDLGQSHPDRYNGGGQVQLADVLIVEAVGCEAFAKMAYDNAVSLLEYLGIANRVHVAEVEVREHGANGVLYTGNR
jgi:6-pyruvoyltetrahydropterin/6-carboxytetrahydropterin synthase